MGVAGLEEFLERKTLAMVTAGQLAAHTAEAVALLTEIIVGRTLAEWAERFTTLAGRGPRCRTPSRPAATRRSAPTSTSCPLASSSWCPARPSST
jgi:hypothetical protein